VSSLPPLGILTPATFFRRKFVDDGSRRALVAALAEMYVQGGSTRRVKAITEELRGPSFSASSISAMNQPLDAGLAQFAGPSFGRSLPLSSRP
jgi:transposase-like protein